MNLIQKYNVPAPRYTSYPTVPYWEDQTFSTEKWLQTVIRSFMETNQKDGISLYIHLPFCEKLCTYCGCNKRITINHKVEEPYIEALLKEWEMYKQVFLGKPVIREIHLGGGTPTFFSPQSLQKMMDGLLDGVMLHKDHAFSFEAHPNNTTREHLETLYKAGFRRLSLGVQDFDPKVQDMINRIQTFEVTKEVVDIAREIGYQSVNFDLIYGLPLQKLSSIKDTIEKSILIKPDRISFYSYAHVPWYKPSQRKYTEADLPKDEEKRILYETGKAMFIQKDYEEIGMDHFALRSDALYAADRDHQLHRNFMGYTDNHTQLLIGLGCSSISDSWYGFAQNEKTVEGYEKLVNKGEFPIVRGHILDKEDLLLRKHVLNIMCTGRTSFSSLPVDTELKDQILQRLEVMQEDSLLILIDDDITVTETGKAFLRNICMAFDARLWRKTPESEMFSSAV